MSTHDRLLHISSAHRTNPAANACDFSVHLNGAIHLQNQYITVKSLTVPNMFENVYGIGCVFYWWDAAGVPHKRSVTPGSYTGVGAVLVAFDTQIHPETTSGAASSSFDATYTCTLEGGLGWRPMTQSEIWVNFKQRWSLNHILGVGSWEPYPPGEVSHPMTNRVSLGGPTVLFVGSERIAFGKSIRGGGQIGSHFTSASLHDVPWGYVCHHRPRHDSVYFGAETNLNKIDITISDEYGQTLSLPHNQTVQLELLISAVDGL